MFFLLISCFTFVFFFKSLSFKPIKSFEWKLSNFIASWFQKGRPSFAFFHVPMRMQMMKKMKNGAKEREPVMEDTEDDTGLIDLPELALENILERLSPADLCSLGAACNYLRERCTSDYPWEKHLNQKWGGVISDAAYREWQWHVASSSSSSMRSSISDQNNQKCILGPLSGVWPFSWIRPKLGTRRKSRTSLPVDSIMALYLSLESGKFWFPAQVYNRENGHIGFMLSCYDAQVSYDSQTDTFQARYCPYGRRTIEESITWDRLRAPPVDTPADLLHISDCLGELKPGDHVEVQWRRSREFPYGWWYAVVGHLESCDGNQNHCHCHYSDKVVVEFNQYTPGSRWRQTLIDRKSHQEEGNEADGFYGGIRKLYKEEEISIWKRLWPNQVYD